MGLNPMRLDKLLPLVAEFRDALQYDVGSLVSKSCVRQRTAVYAYREDSGSHTGTNSQRSVLHDDALPRLQVASLA